MKLLAVFVGICAVLVAGIAWVIFEGTRGGFTPASQPPPITERPAPQRAMHPAPSNEMPATEEQPVAAKPATPPTSQPLVHWAGDPGEQAAARRLERAQAALRDDPEHAGALRDEAEALAALGRWSQAADVLARRVELDADNAALRFDYAVALVKAQRWVDAIGALQKIVRSDPRHAGAWFNLAVAHQAAGHLGDARAAWDRVLELAPRPEACARRGEVLLDLHEWAAAAADFEAVLRAQPDAADATMNLALALASAKRGDEARTLLVEFVGRHTCHVPALNRLAELAWTTFQAAPAESVAAREEAVEWWRRSLECDPEQAEVRAALEAAR